MTRHAALVFAVASLIGIASLTAQSTPPAADLLIRNARIVDGTGAPWFRSDVAVSGDAIAAVGVGLRVAARRTIDAGGQVVAPGFIDTHTHARRGIFVVPTADNYARQGVTTLIEGPDGSSPLPIAEFLAKVAATPTSVNFGTLVGQGSVREAVIGDVNRRATPEEIAKMRDLVDRAMRDGAFGLSTGLFYVPGTFTPTDEIVELAKVAAAYGGIHTSHMREETSHVADSVRETIEIGERGGLPTQVTHHKVIGATNRGRSVETLRLVAEARARGVDATVDQYPYTASSTGMDALLPSWALEGGDAATRERLNSRELREKMRPEVLEMLLVNRGGGDPKNVQIASYPADPSCNGKTLAEVLRARGRAPTNEEAVDLVMEIVGKGGAQTIFHAINEEDLERILVSPFTMIASDGEIPVFGKASPHPRSYGTFVRVLGTYVREKHLLSLEEAVRKMTSMPAARLGLPDRGIVRPGMKADLVVFDPAAIADRATFENPHQYAVGVSTVVVNGQIVFDGSAMTAARPGRVLYGQGKR